MPKILFVEVDDTAFQFRQCMARVLNAIPEVELFHAHDATEALQLLDNIKPDVIVLDDDMAEESSLFLDSLVEDHPPVLFQVDPKNGGSKPGARRKVTYITKDESLEGFHATLVTAAHLASNSPSDMLN